jgi:hypothetical protein
MVLFGSTPWGWSRSVLGRSYPTLNVESHLLFADERAANVVTGNGWAALAAKEFGIAMEVIALSKEVINTIKEAQRRQDIQIPDECIEEA